AHKARPRRPPEWQRNEFLRSIRERGEIGHEGQIQSFCFARKATSAHPPRTRTCGKPTARCAPAFWSVQGEKEEDLGSEPTAVAGASDESPSRWAHPSRQKNAGFCRAARRRMMIKGSSEYTRDFDGGGVCRTNASCVGAAACCC